MQFDDFMDIVNVLGNPTAYAKKIAELKAYDQSIKDNLDATVDVSKLKALLDTAAASIETAKQTKATAIKDAEKIVADARVVYDKRYESLFAKEDAASVATSEANQIKLDQAVRENEMRTKEKELSIALKRLADSQQQTDVLQLELTERLDKLRSVMG